MKNIRNIQDIFQSDQTNRSNEPPRNQQLRLFSQTFQASQGLIRSIGRVKHRLESVVYQTHRLALFLGPGISNQQIPTKCKGISEKFRWNESKSWRWNSTTFHTEFKSYTCFFQGHFSFSSWRGDEWWNQLITCPPPLWIKFASSMFISFFVLKLRSFCFFATSECIAIWKKTLRSVSGFFLRISGIGINNLSSPRFPQTSFGRETRGGAIQSSAHGSGNTYHREGGGNWETPTWRIIPGLLSLQKLRKFPKGRVVPLPKWADIYGL